MRLRCAHAFTLIELLVVISIVGVLIGLLLPALGFGRHVARAMQCMSNIRQIEVAHYSYMVANNGTMIDVGLAHGGLHADETTAWIKTLQDYWASSQDSGHGIEVKARSPLDDSPHWGPAPAGVSIPGAGADQRRRTSYGLNDYLTTAAPVVSQRHTKLGMIRSPATTVHVQIMAFEGEFAGADHAHNTSWYGGGGTAGARPRFIPSADPCCEWAGRCGRCGQQLGLRRRARRTGGVLNARY